MMHSVFIKNFAANQKHVIMPKSVFSLFALALIATMSSCKEQVTESPKVPLVKTQTIVINSPADSHDYPGIIKPQDELSIAFKVNGQIKSILDKSGMEVKKGGMLVSLDSHDYKVSLNATQAAYKQSKNEFERVKQLYAAKSISPNDFEKAEAAHQVVCSKYQAAKDAFEYTRIQAPFDGYIQNVYHQKGEIVQAGIPVMTFISKNVQKVEVFLPFRDFERIGSLKESKMDINGNYIDLKLGSICHQANAAQLYKAEFHILPNDMSNKIVAGKNCQVRLTFSTTNENDAARIPLSAIMNINNETSVWILENQNIATKVSVKIRSVDHNMATVSGLKTGQQIVTSGIHTIKEGEAVKIMPAPSETNIGGML